MLLFILLIFATILGVHGQCTLHEKIRVYEDEVCSADIFCDGTTENMMNIINNWACMRTGNRRYDYFRGEYVEDLDPNYNINLNIRDIDTNISEDPLIDIIDEEVIEKRARRLSEMQRLARQAIEDAIQAKRAAKERYKLELLKTGNLTALEKLKQEPDDDEVDIVVPEALSDVEEEEESDVEDENEYFPPAGLLIPGFYAPPNDIAKTNGLAILFPKLVLEHVTPQPEFLPPHVLVMISMEKRHKAIGAMSKYKKEIIHMGIFKATCPFDAVHIAYSLRQFDTMQKRKTYKLDKLRLAFMVSTKCDLTLLQLVDLGPAHVSRDEAAGEVECAALFAVDYADHYPQFEDFDV